MKPLTDPAVRAELAAAFDRLWPATFPLGAVVPLRPTVADLLAEFEKAGEQYGAEGEAGPASVAVAFTTKPVVFDHVRLGRFRVTLATEFGAEAVGWDVTAEALEPHPSAGNEECTHPHVHGDSPCLGDAEETLPAALQEGRFLDACDLMTAHLHTYCEASCYSGATLEEWEGHVCDNCGACGEDEPGSCAGCRDDLCEHCDQSGCVDCEDSFHDACVRSCRGCREAVCRTCEREVAGRPYCSNCAERCEGCDDWFRTEDLDGDGRCEGCREPDEDEDEDEGEAAPAPAPEPAGGDPCGTCQKRFAPADLHHGVCAPCAARTYLEGDGE